MLLLFFLQVVGSCSPADGEVLANTLERIRQGDDVAVVAPSDRCADRAVASLALEGWREARALAPQGGPVALLGPVRAVLDRLEAFAGSDRGLEAEYAATAIRAAVAAAQDERPEMELLLDHARDLAERLARRGRRAVWPRSYNLLAGDLWLEVDRFDTAARAFERAVAADPSPLAWIGLARAHARGGRGAEACRAYQRVQEAAPPLAAEARAALARCR